MLNHKGKHFSVRGPLNVARSPQGHAVLFQAGSSGTGREVAARFAEGVFTPQHTLEGAQEFYRDLKGRMARYGRPREALKIMARLNAIVDRTKEEAQETHRFLQSKIHQRFAGARGQRTLIGSPVEIVDEMENWFCGYGVDGFLIHPSHLPGGLNDFVELVVPELQNRRLFRSDYEGTTLRENLGLQRPANRYAAASH